VLLDIVFLAPVIATIVSTINFLLVLNNFRGKPWNFKIWLIASMFFWIPWAGSTVLMRLAETRGEALLYLQISYISSYITFYSLYRFHNMLDQRRGSKFFSFFIAVYMGINVALGVNSKYLSVIQTADGQYFTDSFSSTLFILHVVFTIVVATLVFLALRDMNALTLFYSSSESKSRLKIAFALVIIAIEVFLLLVFFLSGGRQDSTAFLLFSILITSFLGVIYGVRPISSILAPQRLWSYFIVDKSGLPLYEYHFSDTENIGDLALISGAINASNATIMSYMRSKKNVEEVELDDRVILIENHDDLLYCVVADSSTQQLQIIHQEVSTRIANDESVISRLNDQTEQETDFVEQLVKNGFSASFNGGF